MPSVNEIQVYSKFHPKQGRYQESLDMKLSSANPFLPMNSKFEISGIKSFTPPPSTPWFQLYTSHANFFSQIVLLDVESNNAEIWAVNPSFLGFWGGGGWSQITFLFCCTILAQLCSLKRFLNLNSLICGIYHRSA